MGGLMDKICPSCGYPMFYSESDGFWYCYNCGYMEKD
ncbi:Sjogren's syndrome/scleroderma autoantigen 1 family protein [Methanobacterium aggregans]